jgi:hypothetical protein
MATPGHTRRTLTTLVTTGSGFASCTHLWWSGEEPATDPLAEDQQLPERSCEELLALAPALIVPVHGAPFRLPRPRATVG